MAAAPEEAGLEEKFLEACKAGDIEAVRLAISLNVDVNYKNGWGLRRAVRYNHPQIWDSLLLHSNIQVNLANQFGLTALHTACRFNIPSAVTDLLRHPYISVNEQTVMGTTALMVAVKYGKRQAVEILIRDKRVSLDVLDCQNRGLENVVGIAVAGGIGEQDTLHIFELIQDERRRRVEDDGRRNSLDEDGLQVDGQHRTKVFDKLKELVEELRELHKKEIEKLQEGLEQDSLQFQIRIDQELNEFLLVQDQERLRFMERITLEREQLNSSQRTQLERLLKKQEEESHFLQYSRLGGGDLLPDTMYPQSPKQSALSGSRRQSLTNSQGEKGTQMTSASVSSSSPWDLSTPPDEGYLTSKECAPEILLLIGPQHAVEAAVSTPSDLEPAPI